MGDANHHHRLNSSSRLGLRNAVAGAGGEIVEVQGGHIVRSTGRKDRHSKVCTAKGPRDRRVRLSAHTAIQFYDVQDRLGYDRPSKAVDWLIKKAKASIDELAELPPWHPTTATGFKQHDGVALHQQHGLHEIAATCSSGKRPISMLAREDEQGLHVTTEDSRNQCGGSGFLPSSLDSDVIEDSIKTFFPMGGASGESNPPAVQFHHHHSFPPAELLSRTGSQDLRLSLQSFQEPILIHHASNPQTQNQQNHNAHAVQLQAHPFYAGTAPLGFELGGWSENQRMTAAWNAGGGDAAVAGSGPFMLNMPTTPPLLQPLFGQNQMFSQRGPLQSSNTPWIRAWMDPTVAAITMAAAAGDHHHLQTIPIHHHPSSSLPGIEFAPGIGGGFSRFRVPARIQGEEEEHDGISDKPSSASSDSRH